MTQPRLAALFLAVLAAGTAVLVTIVALLVQFRGGTGQTDVWRSLVVALGGVGIALSVMGLVHLSFIAARTAAGSGHANLVVRWLQVWSVVAAGAKAPSVAKDEQVVAAEAASQILQSLSGDSAERVRVALRSSGVIEAELRRAQRGIGPENRSSIEALERLAWIAAPEALPLFESAVTGGARAARAALLGSMRILATRSRPDEVVGVVVDMIHRHLRSTSEPEGARPFLTAVLLSSGDHLGSLCSRLMNVDSHEIARVAAIEALCKSQRPEAGELAGSVLLRGARGETKAAALKGLARVGLVPPAVAAAVADATRDPDMAVRVNATHALAGVAAAQALPTLWECLADRAWEVRLAASDTLLGCGRQGVELLRRAAFEHSDRFARDIAGMALGLTSPTGPVIEADDLLDLGIISTSGGGGGRQFAPASEARA